MAVILGSGIVFLDSTVVNVALPQIGDDLPGSIFEKFEGQNYVYYGYLLSLSSLLVLAGGLTDHRGRKKMFAVGLGTFGATSLLCGLAPNMEILIAMRLLQGAAGALLVPGSLSIISATFEGEEQGHAFGLWAAASAATAILGPPIGGALVTYVSWRWVFFINIPLVTVGLYATIKHMEETRDETSTGRFDIIGAVVVALAVGGLAFGAIRGEAHGWGADALTSLALGVIATIYLPFHMKRSPHPLIPPHLFRSRNFLVTNISTLIIYGALYVTFQLQAFFFIGTVGYNELTTGLSGLPIPLILALFSTKVGTLAARHGSRMFMAIGPAIMGLGLLWLLRFPIDSDPWVPRGGDLSSFLPPMGYFVDLFPSMLIFGIGLTIMVAPLTTALMRSVPVRHSGVASAINNAISRVGPLLVGAALFIVISSTFYASLAEKSGVDTSSPSLQEEISPLNAPEEGTDTELARAAKEASTEAFHLAMAIAALLCFGGAVVNWVGIDDEQVLQVDAPEGEAAPAMG